MIPVWYTLSPNIWLVCSLIGYILRGDASVSIQEDPRLCTHAERWWDFCAELWWDFCVVSLKKEVHVFCM